jgi:polar amino acid transport system permease protein
VSVLGGSGALGPDQRTGLTPPAGSRAPRLLDLGDGGARSILIAIASTIVVFGLLGLLIVSSPGWPEVQRAFFNGQRFAASLPRQLDAFVQNLWLFGVAEVLILPLALVIAVMRSLPAAVFFPLRVLAVLYTDFFRGVPGLLIIVLLGFGIPTLGLPGVPNDPFFWGLTSLVLVYAAYVAEVYRAGIDSVHPSQAAAARSLGLSQVQALRFVVLPQAVRRVIPPLLNDFIGLLMDTALVSTIGVVEVFRQAQIDEAATFNFTPFLVTALFFLVITIPLARFTDWLVERDRRRRLASGVFA